VLHLFIDIDCLTRCFTRVVICVSFLSHVKKYTITSRRFPPEARANVEITIKNIRISNTFKRKKLLDINESSLKNALHQLSSYIILNACTVISNIRPAGCVCNDNCVYICFVYMEIERIL
jgi:hypothetical protein